MWKHLDLEHVSIPFTSGHVFRQFIRGGRRRGKVVSIPFTSGHVFRHVFLAVLLRQEVSSQSLLHQVTYSDNSWLLRPDLSFTCLNPFYIRSRIPTSRNTKRNTGKMIVSIPFTSGHVFRQRWRENEEIRGRCLNPFYIRSRIPTFGNTARNGSGVRMSQSLLHQVTYSD